MAEQQTHSVTYDPTDDILTFDGFKFSGELMRQFTATPCGISFRITERRDRTVTVSQDRDPLAVLAPEMLAALRAADNADEHHANCEECEGLGAPEACERCFPEADDARVMRRAVLAKNDGLSQPVKTESEG